MIIDILTRHYLCELLNGLKEEPVVDLSESSLLSAINDLL